MNFKVLEEGRGLEGYRDLELLYLEVIKTPDFWYVICRDFGIKVENTDLPAAIKICKNSIENLLESKTISDLSSIKNSFRHDYDDFETIELEFRYPAYLHIIEKDPEYIQTLDKEFGKHAEDYSSHYWLYKSNNFESKLKINLRTSETSVIFYFGSCRIIYSEDLAQTENDVFALIEKIKNPFVLLK